MFIFNNEREIEDLGGGIKRKLLAYGGKMMAVEVYFEKDAIGTLHSHPHEQITYVLSGTFEFTIENEIHIVKAGDTLYKEPNVIHGCVCLDAGKLLDVFTPQRLDFIK